LPFWRMMMSEIRQTVFTEDVTRPLYYKDLERRVRDYCYGGGHSIFTESELKAIVADYLNVVYRKQWKADHRFIEHEIALQDLRGENESLVIGTMIDKSSIRKLTKLYESTIYFKIKTAFSNFKSYFKTGER